MYKVKVFELKTYKFQLSKVFDYRDEAIYFADTFEGHSRLFAVVVDNHGHKVYEVNND